MTTMYHNIDNSRITRDFINLPFADPSKVQVEYIWIDGSEMNVRSKQRTCKGPINSVKDIPDWSYDGSSTNQASGSDSEVIIKPCRIFKDPFNPPNGLLVMCDTYLPNGEPHETNRRFLANKIFNEKLDEKPWFGIEQEYVLLTREGHPLGWPMGGFPGPQGPYYCGVGANVCFGREFIVAHYHACLYAGIDISGVNAEVMPGQWEFQVGPSVGIDAADQLWMARFILDRMGEVYRVAITLDPKPVQGDWNGGGAHINFSTESMRKPQGIKHIMESCEKLKKNHLEHMIEYGEGNERRMTGKHETSSYYDFSYGVANRGASIRIPRETEKKQCGYLEDRRPASNMDPYRACSKLFATCCDVDISKLK
eukprot:GCRY01000946.1.p1 GENE.GCRY01000946.1~~GCRY01000946.1.p1  ORF type:complete len:367 (+),score=46.78 GCRY01000946.1:110-1210(+)